MELHAEWTPAISDLLRTDIDSRIVIIDDESIILSVNESAAHWLNAEANAIKGKPLSSVMTASIAQERIELAREVLQSRGQHLLDGLIDGEGLRCSIRPLPWTSVAGRGVILSFRWLFLIDEDSDHAVVAAHNELGPLERLTPRELEIMVLVAQGYSTDQIALQLRRSRRTIDCHRATIGHKLNLSSITSWVSPALRAGLLRIVRSPDDLRQLQFAVSNQIQDLLMKSLARGSGGRIRRSRRVIATVRNSEE